MVYRQTFNAGFRNRCTSAAAEQVSGGPRRKTRNPHSASRKPGTGSALGFIFTIVVAAVIGALFARLGSVDFQTYVRTFHSHRAGSTLYRSVAALARDLCLVAWTSPLIGSIYYGVRSGRAFEFAVVGGIIGCVFGFCIGGPVHASPGPNYDTSEYTVPIECFVGTLLGAVFQSLRPPEAG